MGVDKPAELPSVASFVQAAGAHPSLALRIQEADVDRDGQLSKGELLQVFAAEVSAQRSKKRMGYALAAAVGLLVVALAANAGLTYAVVALSRDTEVSPSGALVATGGGGVIKVGQALNEGGLGDLALWLAPSNVTGLHSLTLPLPDGEGFAWHRMAGAEVRPGQRATIYTDAGAVITVVAAPDGGAPVVTLHSTGLPGQKDAADGSHRHLLHNLIGLDRTGSRRGFTHTHHANGSYSLMEGNIATGIWF